MWPRVGCKFNLSIEHNLCPLANFDITFKIIYLPIKKISKNTFSYSANKKILLIKISLKKDLDGNI